MVARTRTDPSVLLVTFSTDGEEPEQQLASGGERALKVAIIMLARRDALQHGDTLTVARADDGGDHG